MERFNFLVCGHGSNLLLNSHRRPGSYTEERDEPGPVLSAGFLIVDNKKARSPEGNGPR